MTRYPEPPDHPAAAPLLGLVLVALVCAMLAGSGCAPQRELVHHVETPPPSLVTRADSSSLVGTAPAVQPVDSLLRESVRRAAPAAMTLPEAVRSYQAPRADTAAALPVVGFTLTADRLALYGLQRDHYFLNVAPGETLDARYDAAREALDALLRGTPLPDSTAVECEKPKPPEEPLVEDSWLGYAQLFGLFAAGLLAGRLLS